MRAHYSALILLALFPVLSPILGAGSGEIRPQERHNIDRSRGSIPLSIDSMLADIGRRWQQDTGGCRHLRRADDLDSLFTYTLPETVGISQVFELLGEPDAGTPVAGGVILRYFLNTQCRDGIPVAEADKCWGAVVVDSNADMVKWYGVECE